MRDCEEISKDARNVKDGLVVMILMTIIVGVKNYANTSYYYIVITSLAFRYYISTAPHTITIPLSHHHYIITISILRHFLGWIDHPTF